MAAPTPQQFVSNGKIKIDMPGPRGANKQLLTCKKFSAKEDGSVDVVTTIGVPNGAGWRQKQGGWKITMTFIRTAGTEPEVDFIYAKQTKKQFTITSEDEDNGRIRNWFCRVSKIDSDTDDQGSLEDEVELAAIELVSDQ
jgi:hypothetical protein